MRITDRAIERLIPSLATCGGTAGMLFPVAQALVGKKGGDLYEIVPKYLGPMVTMSLKCLEEEATDGEITALSVVRRYGLPKHFHDMNQEAMDKMESVAGEIPVNIRAIAHTLLPVRHIKDGWVYANEGRIITLKGLVPLGPQEGNLVAHLAGVFNSGCSDREIEELLHEQAKDSEFLMMADADEARVIDYTETSLREFTLKAKDALNL